MDRRKFIKNTTAAMALPFWLQGCDFFSNNNFPIHVHSDHNTVTGNACIATTTATTELVLSPVDRGKLTTLNHANIQTKTGFTQD
ncbi:MAG: hypothetical protein AAFY41_18295, partial [Bacteroidota bacterium]